ncbi:protein of unknown function [Candidatus Hydrogenisulfobacillus filiaventi]|uniref:Uncharacterized protein n=1 Tax=Candidatus Hydrogenisulfobacillus filiaventi TaxID=2707344 RepID=A0A6F8ZID9_9FIRM|nr:protein of unknown function [Candidatus Hydrogenisulfobacillus filiaventi]
MGSRTASARMANRRRWELRRHLDRTPPDRWFDEEAERADALFRLDRVARQILALDR